MIDIKTMKRNDPVVILKEEYKGRLGYFLNPYPYPDGDLQCIIELAGGKIIGGKKEKVLLSIDDVIKLDVPANELVATPAQDTNVPEYADYKIGARVIIAKEGKYRGQVGLIRGVYEIAGGCLIDYDVEPIGQAEDYPRVAMRLREEDLVPAGYSRMTIKGFDVGKYLDRNTLQNVAMEIYEESVRSFVNEILTRRTIGNTSITDYILAEVASRYCDELAPEYKDEFLQKIKDEIAKDIPKSDDEYGMSFCSMFTNALVKCGEDYINTHKDEIQTMMVDSIKNAIDKFSADSLATVLRRHVDIKTILSEALTEKKEEK